MKITAATIKTRYLKFWGSIFDLNQQWEALAAGFVTIFSPLLYAIFIPYVLYAMRNEPLLDKCALIVSLLVGIPVFIALIPFVVFCGGED